MIKLISTIDTAKLRMAYNNDIIRFYSDSPLTAKWSDINDNSRPVDSSSKKSIYSLNRDAAFQIWENVKKYLIRISDTDFPNHQNAAAQGLRFKKII